MYIFLSEYEYVSDEQNAGNTTQVSDDPYQELNQTTMDPEARRHDGRKQRPLQPDTTDPGNVGGHALRAALDMVLLWRSSVRGDHRLVTARSANHGEGSTEQHEDLSAIADQPTTDAPHGMTPVSGTEEEGPYQTTVRAPIIANEGTGYNPDKNKNGESACASGGESDDATNQNQVGASADLAPHDGETHGEADSLGCGKQNALDHRPNRGSSTVDRTGDEMSDEREDNQYITLTESWDGYEIPTAKQP